MFRRLLVPVCVSVLFATAALAQPPPPLLIATPFSRAVVLSVSAVQLQVDATLIRAGVSQKLIAEALAQLTPPLLLSTPIPRR
jgi:hypothetical protein